MELNFFVANFWVKCETYIPLCTIFMFAIADKFPSDIYWSKHHIYLKHSIFCIYKILAMYKHYNFALGLSYWLYYFEYTDELMKISSTGISGHCQAYIEISIGNRKRKLYYGQFTYPCSDQEIESFKMNK